jgi:hypothetical protein
MTRFLNKLLRDSRTTGSARGGRRGPRRTTLQVEALEDRTVPTTVSQFRSTLYIGNMAQGHTITLESDGNRHMEVYDNGALVVGLPSIFNIGSINTVQITAANDDLVVVDDSNGMPFAQGTTINLFANGGAGLKLTGSRAVTGNETYVAGYASSIPGLILLDNLRFNLDPSITYVEDYIPITGNFDVQTSGTAIQAGGLNSAGITPMAGLGSGGGGTLDYSYKPYVTLEEYQAYASINLGYQAENLEQTFTVNMHGLGDTVTIAGTVPGVLTTVNSVVAPVANAAVVDVEANSGAVVVNGSSSTKVTLGDPVGNGRYSTKGIDAYVSVNGAASLVANDSANVLSPADVTVTPSTISGIGLFGNNAVTVYYSNVTVAGVVYQP